MIKQEKAKQYLFSYMKHSILDICDIILFGSYVRKDERFDSDIDVLVVINEMNQNEVLKCIRELNYVDDDTAEIDIKFITKEKWDSSNSTFINNVRREGINVTEEFRNLL